SRRWPLWGWDDERRLELGTRTREHPRPARGLPDHAAGHRGGLRDRRGAGSGGRGGPPVRARGAHRAAADGHRVHPADPAGGAADVRVLPPAAVLGVADRHRRDRDPLRHLYGGGVPRGHRRRPAGPVGGRPRAVTAGEPDVARGRAAPGHPEHGAGARELRDLAVQGHPVPVRHHGGGDGDGRAAVRCPQLPVPRADHARRRDLSARELPDLDSDPETGEVPCLLTTSPWTGRELRATASHRWWCSTAWSSSSVTTSSWTTSTSPSAAASGWH